MKSQLIERTIDLLIEMRDLFMALTIAVLFILRLFVWTHQVGPGTAQRYSLFRV